jgi:hypothetical protein
MGERVQVVFLQTKNEFPLRNFPMLNKLLHSPTFMRQECLLKRNINVPGENCRHVDIKIDFVLDITALFKNLAICT